MQTITVKCTTCTKKEKKGNILFQLEPMKFPDTFHLQGKFIKGKCPVCETEILIGVDN